MTQEMDEQFRVRLGIRAAEHFGTHWDAIDSEDRESFCAAAEAVYAAALRDARALIDSPEHDMSSCQECGGGRNELLAYAASLGTDLEDK